MSRTLARLVVAGLVLAAGSTVFTQIAAISLVRSRIHQSGPADHPQRRSNPVTARVGMTVNDARVDIGYMSSGNAASGRIPASSPTRSPARTDMNDQRFDIRATLP